ncbi:hypothetical protein [Novosphingobium resinovorum]|uniref:hypothetical protein n=1 Tax=Novosphingobium resinovorum TaxID=158500 RepID=UPI002ED33B6F|nr:hypothetical protein [Novosphingobium resinovorum]
MNIVKREVKRGRASLAPKVAAILLPLALIALGVAAWNDAGVQTVEDQTIAVPLPALPDGAAK